MPRRLLVMTLLWVSLALIVPSGALAVELTGRVVKVPEGDTIVISSHRREIKLRLHGVDSPEKGQPYWKEAKRYTSFMALDLEVRVKVVGKDELGRTLGEVFLPDGRLLNREILKEGLAWWDRRHSTDEALADMEALAEASRIGLWREPNPVPPWEWRKPGRPKRR